MNSKAESRSITMKLSKIARQRSVPFERVYTEFLIERILIRLVSDQHLKNSFVFKGGYVGQKVYGSPRYTIDLDALIKGNTAQSSKEKIISIIESDIGDHVWFRFQETKDLLTQGEYPGIRFNFKGGLGTLPSKIEIAQTVNLDIGVGDFVEPLQSEILSLLDKSPISWQIYSLEVIIAEKLHSCLSKPVGNSRSKDIFDLLFYLPKADKSLVKKSFKKLSKQEEQNYLII